MPVICHRNQWLDKNVGGMISNFAHYAKIDGIVVSEEVCLRSLWNSIGKVHRGIADGL